MKIILNNIIPFKGYKVVNLFGFLFTKKGVKLDDEDINHERIHTAQMKELLYLPYYIIYLLEFLIKIIPYGGFHKAYRNISFEREAYKYERQLEYLQNRKHYRQWRK